jgi:hypothetical protein
MSFSLRANNDITYICENNATSLPPLPDLPTATTYGQYLFYNNVTATFEVGGNPVKIGDNAGETNQSLNTVAIGTFAGNSGQVGNAVAIGSNAGRVAQNQHSIAIGQNAGNTSQANRNVAIGTNAASIGQAESCVAIGLNAARFISPQGAHCIGRDSGFTGVGGNTILIGAFTGRTNQVANAIVLNATGTDVSGLTSGFFVAPIAVRSTDISNRLVYNQITKEIGASPTKTFIIPHPDDSNKYLVHGCLEGPENGVYYRGQGEITNDSNVEIHLPEYSKHFSDFTISVTPITHTLYSSTGVHNGSFTVRGKNGSFFWLVKANRHSINVEPLKTDIHVAGQGPYKWSY